MLAEGAAEALHALREAGFLLIAASNQPAAAKGTATLDDLRGVHDRVAELLAAEGVELDDWRYCFHHPDGIVPELSGACGCRKPEPGMILDGAEANDVELASSWMVGDSDNDVEAGRRAGVRTLLVANPQTAHRRTDPCAHAIVRNLSDAAGIILDSRDR